MDISLLKRVPIFSLLSDSELEKIRDLCVTQHYEKDRIILIEEESGNTLFIIQKGRVKVSRVSDDGREVILSISWIYELMALILLSVSVTIM